MRNRSTRRVLESGTNADFLENLRKALAKRRKDELVAILTDLAREDRRILRRLTARVQVAATTNELITLTRRAIADATDYDPRDANRNFHYDYETYDAVKRNLCRLIDLGELRSAMELSLELMRKGSEQIEVSDEGLMSSDIEECLQVVIRALKTCSLPTDDVLAWCAAMVESDRVGFVCDREFQTLKNQFESSGT